MPFASYQRIRQEFIEHWNQTQTADNRAAAYDLTIVQPPLQDEQNYWACLGAYHLTADENQGKHVLYLEAIDEENNRVFGAVFKWGWQGQRPDESSPDLVDDKPPHELSNLIIWANQTIWAAVKAPIPSGEVRNVRSTHPDEGFGSTWGHHSFYVAFKRVEAEDGDEPEPPEPPTTPACRDIRRLAENALERLKNAEIELAAAKKDFNSILDICKEDEPS